MSTEKTIRMPKRLLARWLKALRSGEYKQAKDALYDEKTCGFCCLGVLQHVASGGSVEYGVKHPNGLPTKKWLRQNGIRFTGWGGDRNVRSPALPPLGQCADVANDTGTSFKKLADAIEACAKGY